MPTRSVKFKLIVPRDERPESIALRQAIYATHEWVNEAVAYYTRILLEMRQEPVCIGRDAQGLDITEGADMWRSRLMERLTALGLAVPVIAEALPLLRKAYEGVVSGDARGWDCPLFTSNKGGKKGDPVADRLRELNVLPLALRYGVGRLSRPGSATWDSSAFAMAAEGLISHHEKTLTTAAEKQKRMSEREQHATIVARLCPDALAAIREYEQRRQAGYVEAGLSRPGRTYRVTERQLRCWSEVHRSLLACRDASEQERVEIVVAAQRRHRRDFGDATFMRWLAHPDQCWIVEHQAGDVATRTSRLNRAEERAERAREYPRFTFPHARKSPKFGKLGKPEDGNSPQYALKADRGRMSLDLPLLVRGEGGLLTPTRRTFALAPQRQLDGLVFSPVGDDNKRGLQISWNRQDGTGRIVGEIMGGNLMLDRAALAGRPNDQLRRGDLGTVFVKLGVNVNSEYVNPDMEALYQRRFKVAAWLNAALQNRGKKSGVEPWPGFCVMAVDLGIRTAVTVSFFTVNQDGTRPWIVDERCGLHASHVQTVSIPLDGEHATERQQAHRDRMNRRIKTLRHGIWRLRVLTKASTAPVERRAEILNDIVASLAKRTGEAERALSARVVSLQDVAESTDAETWLFVVRDLYRDLEQQVGEAIHRWRQRARAGRDREAGGGLSAWKVSHLEDSLRLLRAWANRTRPGQARRQAALPALGRDERDEDDFKALQKHLDEVRGQRVKQTADLIIQAARGMIYRDGCWRQQLPQADLIVMEDLSRYNFRSDRAPFENSQLMRWCHRGIREAVEMQARVEGIMVADVGAGYSSRFDPLTGAPGVRCHPMSKSDVDGMAHDPKHWLRRHVSGKLARLGFDADRLRPGDLVPKEGGEVLVTVRGEKVSAVNADHRAAQNLARRYLEGYATAFRVYGSVVTVAGRRCLYLDMETSGARLQGALGGKHALFVEGSDGAWAPTIYTTARAAKMAMLGAEVVVDVGADEEEDADDSPSSGGKLGLFRDPSGQLFGGHWVEARRFWPAVEADVAKRLCGQKKDRDEAATSRR